MPGLRSRLLLSLACSVALSSLAFATEIIPPTRPCVLVNDYKEIFTGRVISGSGSTTAQVQVISRYKGSVPGRLVVTTSPLDYGVLHATFEQGETYLFYSSGRDKTGSMNRMVTFWSTKRFADVEPDERKLLDEISRPPHSGSIFGTLTRHLDFRDRAPLGNVRIVAVRGGETYSATTDAKGNFEITGLPKGTYRVGAELPAEFTFGIDPDDPPATVEPHGCFEKDLIALNNATISGQIKLPPGQKVEGTKVLAQSAAGRGADLAGVADGSGRYQIVGLSPGEYVVGLNLGFDFPGAKAPFPATYFPGTQDLNEAKRFLVQGTAHFSGIDFGVGAVEKVLQLKIKATFEDGRPVQDQLIGLSDTGYGIRDGNRTDADGQVTLAVVDGTQYLLMAYRGTDGGCPAPVKVGPGPIPEVVHLVYSLDGCREMENTTTAGTLRVEFHNALSELPVTVSWADGRPAYNANVTLLGHGSSIPIVAVFRSGKNGRVDVPIPLGQEFQMSADVVCSNARRKSPTVEFDTANGIRWRETSTNPNSASAWNKISTPFEPVHFVLPSSTCTSETKPK